MLDDAVDEEVDEDEADVDVDLSELFFSEIGALAALGEEHVLEVYELAAGAAVSSQTKQKISQALEAYWDRKGRKKPEDASGEDQKGGTAKSTKNDARDAAQAREDARVSARGGDTKALLRRKEQTVSRIEQTRARITAITNQYKAAIEGAKTPAEKKRLRAEQKAILTPLKQLRTSDIQTRVGVNKILRARRRELSRKIKAIRDAVKEKRMDLKTAVEPLRTEVESNNAKIKELRALRKRAGKGEKSKALLAAIDGLLEDNASIRSAAKGMRDEFAKERDAASSKIEEEKKGSGFYSEDHPHPPDRLFYSLSELLNNETIIQLQNEIEPLQLAEAKKKGLRTNDYERKAWRPLTLSERKVNFTFLSNSMQKGTAMLDDKFKKAVERAEKSLLDQVKFAIKYNDLKALKKIAVPRDVLKAMSSALTDVQKEMFEVGKRSAARELDVPVPPTSAEVRGAMRVQNDSIVAKIAWNLEATAMQAASEAITKNAGSITDTTQKDALEAVQEAMDAQITLSEEQEETYRLCETAVHDLIVLAEASANTLSVTGSVNMGRGSIFARYPEKVYGYQFSAILDDRTTAICMSLDGIVVRPGSADYAAYSPPRHPNCRSIWVAILVDETFKPEFTDDISGGIPTNKSAMQAPRMKAPVVSEHTAPRTVEMINADIAARQKKIEEYTASGKFTNRIDQHKEAIRALQQGLEGIATAARAALTRKIVLEGGGQVDTPTGYVYHASTPGAAKSIERKGLIPNKDEGALYFAPDGSIASAAGADKNDTVLYRIPAGEVGKMKPKADPHMPPGVPTFYIDNSVPADVIERWDDVKKEWVPLRARSADPELSEIMRGYLMAEGLRFRPVAAGA